MAFHRPINGTISGVVIGDPVTGGVANSVLIVDATGDISQATPVAAGTFLRWNGVSFDFAASAASMVVGNAVSGGTDPSVLFVQGGLLAQDPTGFGYIPSQVFAVDIDHAQGEGYLKIDNSSFEARFGNISEFTADANKIYHYFNNQLVSARVIINYINAVGTPFTVGETVTEGGTLDTGIVVSDVVTGIGTGTLVLNPTSGSQWTAPDLITGGTSGATADIDTVTITNPLEALIGITQDATTLVDRYITIESDVANSRDGIYMAHPVIASTTIDNGAGNVSTVNVFPGRQTQIATIGTNTATFDLRPVTETISLGMATGAGDFVSSVFSTSQNNILDTVSDGTISSSFEINAAPLVQKIRGVSNNATYNNLMQLDAVNGIGQIINIDNASGGFTSVKTTASTGTAELQSNSAIGKVVTVTTNHVGATATINATDGVGTANGIYDGANYTITELATDGGQSNTLTIAPTVSRLVSAQILPQIGVYDANPLSSVPFAGALVEDSGGAGISSLSGITTTPTMYVENSITSEIAFVTTAPTNITSAVLDPVNSSTLVQTATGFIMDQDLTVPDEAYGAGWDGSLEVPTKNAIYKAIQSSIYSPTASANSNLDANPTMTGRYTRVGNMVHVSGTFLANPTAGGATSFEISLPFASNLGVFSDATGGFSINGAIAVWEGGTILAETTNNTLRVEWQATNTTNQTYTWWADYQII